MKKYIYRAKDANGALVKGEVEAVSPSVAARLVREKGMVVVTLNEVREGLIGVISDIRNRVTSADVTTFTRQFSTMINAGLPITESLAILRSQTKPTFQAVINQILSAVESGESLSKAFSQHKTIFSPTYIALVRAGEAGGVLDKVLARLADDLEKNEEFRGKVKGALIYPAIIVIGMVIVGIIMMIFVVPSLTNLYTEFDAELPLPTQILISISNLLIQFWPILLVLLIILAWGANEYRKTPVGRRHIDELIFKIPIFGPLQKEIILAELARTLALMVGSGVSILEGLAVTAGVVSNTLISEALRDAATQIEKGFPIAFSFAKHPEAFPYLFSQMVAVGEESGKMEEVLLKISRVYEVESDQKVKALTTAIEPIVMVVLGIGVAFLVIAIILPIYGLTNKF